MKIFFQIKLKCSEQTGGEYTSKDFEHFLSLYVHGITHPLSCPHIPQQNGLVEGNYRDFIEYALALLS